LVIIVEVDEAAASLLLPFAPDMRTAVFFQTVRASRDAKSVPADASATSVEGVQMRKTKLAVLRCSLVGLV
jgi:hypothetical protein